MNSGRSHCLNAIGVPQSLGIVLAPLQVVQEARELVSWSIPFEFALQRFRLAERLLAQWRIEGVKLCRLSVDYEPANTACKQSLRNSLGHGITMPIAHDK